MNRELPQKPPVLKLIVVITERHKAQKVSDVFQAHHVHFHFMFPAEGTASSEILDLLGLSDTEKIVALCLEPDFMVPRLMHTIGRDLELYTKGKGIAFTIPLSGICAQVPEIFNQKVQAYAERMSDKMKDIEVKKDAVSNDLIIAVINQGFSDDLMDAAKEAGATGGTIIHASRVNTEEMSKFFGISLQAEKEIVAIVTPRTKKRAIMQAISRQSGLSSEAKGIIFSLPVSDLQGIQLSDEEDSE